MANTTGRVGNAPGGGIIELEQYLLNYLLKKNVSTQDETTSSRNATRRYPFAADQMFLKPMETYNNFNHGHSIQQTLDGILMRSLRRTAAITIQNAWRFYNTKDTRANFNKLIKATLKIGRAFRKYRACKKDKERLERLRQAREVLFSDGTDSDSTSQDEDYDSEEEEEYRCDYDSGCFIRLPRKAYAAQKIQACFRGYFVRLKSLELYTLVKSAQICISRYWRGYQARLLLKTIRRQPFQKLVVEISDHDTWEHQLELIRSEAKRREIPIIPYKYTSPEKTKEIHRGNDGEDSSRGNNAFDSNGRIIASTALVYRSNTGWKSVDNL